MSQLFVINGVDFTKQIAMSSYIVNRKDVGESWVDGNKTEHMYIYRQQIEGTFQIKPESVEMYLLFCSTINENKILTGKYAGSVLASMYLNNENAFVNAYVRITFDPANELPYISLGKTIEGFEVSIKEV